MASGFWLLASGFWLLATIANFYTTVHHQTTVLALAAAIGTTNRF